MEIGGVRIKQEPQSPPLTPRHDIDFMRTIKVKQEPQSPPVSPPKVREEREVQNKDDDENETMDKEEEDDENETMDKEDDEDNDTKDKEDENDEYVDKDVVGDAKEDEEDEESSDGECAGTPIREGDSDDCSENENSKEFEFSSKSSPERKSFTTAMEGELDFEDEVQERKEEISKDVLYEDSQKETEIEEKFMDKEKDVDEEKELQSSDDEDGQLSPEKMSKDDKEEGSMEEGEDDGEISDDDDLEEGEVKDSTPAVKQPTRQVCRFFNRGQCTWGTLCRFLHLSVNDRGNYNMFAPSPRLPPPFPPPGAVMGMGPHPGPAHLGQRGPRNGPEYHPPPPLPPPPPPVSDAPIPESSWERGLRHAKEMMKKASRRKEQEPDFEEKRLNLSLEESDRVTSEYDKENEYFGKPPHRRNESQSYNRYDEPNEPYDNGEREAREHWRGGRYENFEIRWTRQDLHKDRRDKDRQRNTRLSTEREKFPKQLKGKDRWREDRISEIQTRPRADEWRDPWRRSKTPKGRSRSRGRSRGSYSSVSSHSYSDRSSHSSRSYSRSSSRSSVYSSKSPSPSRPTQKRRPTPRKDISPPPKVPNRISAFKRKPVIPRRTRSRSYTRSRSSPSMSRTRSSSSRSRSITRTPSPSRSRSYTRSLSMDSVSSASSSITHSSSGSGSLHNRNAHMSILRKDEVKHSPPKIEVKTTTSSLYEEMQRLKQYEKMKEREKAAVPPEKQTTVTNVSPREKRIVQEPVIPVQYIQPPSEKITKEPLKHSLHKQQIKLTLLNKASTKAIPNALKREAEAIKAKLNEKEEPVKATTKVGSVGGVKRPLSPTLPNAKPAAVLAPKRSTSSRRDELLKQLKAVEDAIARKRAKFS